MERLQRCLLLLFCFCFPAILGAENAVMVSFHSGEGKDDPLVEEYGAYLANSLEAALAEKNLVITKTIIHAVSPSLEEARNICDAEKVRRAVLTETALSEKRFSWRIAVYDRDRDYYRAVEAFSARIYSPAEAGIARESIDSSVQKLVQSWEASRSASPWTGIRAVTEGQRFRYRDGDGARVRFGVSPEHSEGTAGFIDAGVIEDGVLQAPHIPFARGAPVHVEVSKDKYWTGHYVLRKGITGDEVPLPALQIKARHMLSLSFSALDVSAGTQNISADSGGLNIPGIFSAELGYRFNIFPDRVFARAAWNFGFRSSELSEGKKAFHGEFRLGPGLYLQRSPNAPFRFYAGTGFSVKHTTTDVKLLFDPLWGGMEFHFPRSAVISELRLSSLGGLGRDLFAGNKSAFGVDVSLGMMLKW